MHISQLANRYVKSPHDMVSVGDVVTVWVMGVDHERKRVSLTMVKPGTERQRGPQSGGRRGGGPGGEHARGTARPGPARRRARRRAARRLGPHRAPRRRSVGGRAARIRLLAATTATGPPGPGGPRSAEPRPTDRPQGGPPQQDIAERPPAARRARLRPTIRPRRPARPCSWAQRRPAASTGPRAGRPHPEPPAPPPAAPPPPLSKEALEGNVPLRTFGQLKQLWEARTDEPEDSQPRIQPHRAKPAPLPPANPHASVENAQSADNPSPLVNESDNQARSNSS